MSVSAYPLQWPAGRRRIEPGRRKNGRFNRKVDDGRYAETRDISVADALDRLQRELDALGVRYPPDRHPHPRRPCRACG